MLKSVTFVPCIDISNPKGVEPLKFRTALRALAPLLGFMLLIFIGYSLLLSGPLKQRRMEKTRGVGIELQHAGKGLDEALRHTHSALLRLEAGKKEMLRDPQELDARDSLIIKEMDSTLAGLEALQERMQSRKIALDSLIRRAEFLH